MTRNLKALGLALFAVFAMSSMTASAASAADAFTSGTEKALLTGVSHDNEFKITGTSAAFHCTTAKFAGTAVSGSTEATADAEYLGIVNETPHNGTTCTGTPTNPTAIDMNGCDYDLTGNTVATEDGTDAKVSITCPGTNTIAITTSLGVTITVPAQTPTEKGGVTYTNNANGTVTVNATVTGLTYICESSFACGLAGIPTHGNTADYTGTVVVSGFNDSEGLPTPVTEGASTPVSVSTE